MLMLSEALLPSEMDGEYRVNAFDYDHAGERLSSSRT